MIVCDYDHLTRYKIMQDIGQHIAGAVYIYTSIETNNWKVLSYRYKDIWRRQEADTQRVKRTENKDNQRVRAAQSADSNKQTESDDNHSQASKQKCGQTDSNSRCHPKDRVHRCNQHLSCFWIFDEPTSYTSASSYIHHFINTYTSIRFRSLLPLLLPQSD